LIIISFRFGRVWQRTLDLQCFKREWESLLQGQYLEPGVEPVQALTDISRSGYVVIATKPVHRLQIRSIVHN